MFFLLWLLQSFNFNFHWFIFIVCIELGHIRTFSLCNVPWAYKYILYCFQLHFIPAIQICRTLLQKNAYFFYVKIPSVLISSVFASHHDISSVFMLFEHGTLDIHVRQGLRDILSWRLSSLITSITASRAKRLHHHPTMRIKFGDSI